MMYVTRRGVLSGSAMLAAMSVGGVLARRAEGVEVGQKAPDFNLPATTGGSITLAQFRGKPVLIEFYGADFAPV
jgi:hypothetical protein